MLLLLLFFHSPVVFSVASKDTFHVQVDSQASKTIKDQIKRAIVLHRLC